MAKLANTIVDGFIIHKEGAATTSGTTLTIDYSTGTTFELDMETFGAGPSGDIDTFTVNGVTGDSYYKSFILQVTQANQAPKQNITWDASISAVKWPGGSGPTLTATNDKKDIYSFTSWDDGTTWYGKVIGQNYS